MHIHNWDCGTFYQFDKHFFIQQIKFGIGTTTTLIIGVGFLYGILWERVFAYFLHHIQRSS